MKLSEETLKNLVGGRLDSSGKNLIYAKCPFCGHLEFGISLDDNHLFGCFRKKHCGETGNIYKLLSYLRKYELLEDEQQPVNIDVIEVHDFNKKVLYNEDDLILPTRKNIVPGFKRIFQHSYLDERGFTFYNKYKVGITKVIHDLKEYIIFLIEDNFEVKAYVARSLKSKDEIDANNNAGKKFIKRYVNSENTDFTKLLLGYDEIIPGHTKEVILVEGAFSKFNIDKLYNLDDQVKRKCCCTFGAKFSEEQTIKLKSKGIENIIFLFDPDVVQVIKKDSCKAVQYFSDVKIGFIELEDKDPADLDITELNKVFANLYHPLKFFYEKLKVHNLT